MYKGNTEARSRNRFSGGEAINIKHCVWVCVCVCVRGGGLSIAVIIQHAKRMRHILLSSVSSLAVPYFSTLSYKR